MEIKTKHKLLALGLLMLGASACDEQEVAAVRDWDNKSTITVTRIDAGAGSNVVSEGDILEFEIKADRMQEASMDFLPAVTAAFEDGFDYEILEGGTIAPYTTSTILKILIVDDNFPELSETWNTNILVEEISETYLIHPNSSAGHNINLEVKNVNAPGSISYGFRWADDHDDFDVYIYSEAADDYWGEDPYEAATGSYPEVSSALKVGDPDGTYFILVDPYDVAHDETTYTVSVGLEDGSSQVFTGTLDLTNEEHPMVDGLFKILTIVKTGGSVTVTQH